MTRRSLLVTIALATLFAAPWRGSEAFAVLPISSRTTRSTDRQTSSCTRQPAFLFLLANDEDSSPQLRQVPPDLEGIPIPFVSSEKDAFIECYADTVATVNGIEYTIGVPCDYSVALCYYEKDKLVPVELDDKLMDDIFPIAESIVADEFGEELVLQRTPQTLTLVGELEDDDDDEDEFQEDDDIDDDVDDEEEVEVLLSFEHRGTEFNLVRLLDPILLVGRADDSNADKRILLTPQESAEVMPTLEDLFLEFHDDPDGLLP